MKIVQSMTAKQRKSVLSNLKKARKLLTKQWIKGAFHIEKGEGRYDPSVGAYRPVPTDLYCSVGAMQQANGPGEELAYEVLSSVVKRTFAKRVGHRSPVSGKWVSYDGMSAIIEFNDNDKTDNEDVLRVFDKAIKEVSGE